MKKALWIILPVVAVVLIVVLILSLTMCGKKPLIFEESSVPTVTSTVESSTEESVVAPVKQEQVFDLGLGHCYYKGVIYTNGLIIKDGVKKEIALGDYYAESCQVINDNLYLLCRTKKEEYENEREMVLFLFNLNGENRQEILRIKPISVTDNEGSVMQGPVGLIYKKALFYSFYDKNGEVMKSYRYDIAKKETTEIERTSEYEREDITHDDYTYYLKDKLNFQNDFTTLCRKKNGTDKEQIIADLKDIVQPFSDAIDGAGGISTFVAGIEDGKAMISIMYSYHGSQLEALYRLDIATGAKTKIY